MQIMFKCPNCNAKVMSLFELFFGLNILRRLFPVCKNCGTDLKVNYHLIIKVILIFILPTVLLKMVRELSAFVGGITVNNDGYIYEYILTLSSVILGIFLAKIYINRETRGLFISR